MQRAAAIAIVYLMVLGCQKENSLRFTNSPRALELLPNVTEKGLRFFSTTGDTITILQKSKKEVFVESTPLNENIGGSANLDVVSLQKSSLILACDSPSFTFNFSIQAEQSSSTPKGSIDKFLLSWTEDEVENDSFIDLLITDSVMCNGALCSYQDTLSFGGTTSYFNVYFTDRNSATSRIFLNETSGILAFTTKAQITYERIP